MDSGDENHLRKDRQEETEVPQLNIEQNRPWEPFWCLQTWTWTTNFRKVDHRKKLNCRMPTA